LLDGRGVLAAIPKGGAEDEGGLPGRAGAQQQGPVMAIVRGVLLPSQGGEGREQQLLIRQGVGGSDGLPSQGASGPRVVWVRLQRRGQDILTASQQFGARQELVQQHAQRVQDILAASQQLGAPLGQQRQQAVEVEHGGEGLLAPFSFLGLGGVKLLSLAQ